MKKITAVLLIAAALFIAAPAMADDSVFDKTGDWFATLGKSEDEKNSILLQRKTDRAAKKLQHGFDKAGKDLKKAFQ